MNTTLMGMRWLTLLVFAVTLLLVACGDGSDAQPTPASTPEATAEEEPTPTMAPSPTSRLSTPESTGYFGAIMGVWRKEGDAFYVRENGTGVDYRIGNSFDGTGFEERPIVFVWGNITGDEISPTSVGGPMNSQTGCEGILQEREGSFFVDGGDCGGAELVVDETTPLGTYTACGSGEDCTLAEPIEVDAATLASLSGQEVTVRLRWCFLTRNGAIVNPVVAVVAPRAGIAMPDCTEPYPQ